MKRLFSFLLIPLSVLPFVGIAPSIVHSHQRFEREHNTGPFAAPASS